MIRLRMSSDCYICILERAKFECDLVFRKTKSEDIAVSSPEESEEQKGGNLKEEMPSGSEASCRAVMEELLGFMTAHLGGVPALVGTQRERIVKRLSGNPDPYRQLKAESNAVAENLLPIARQFLLDSPDRLEALIRIAAAANSMEFGVKGHSFDNTSFAPVFEATLREDLDGDLDSVKRHLERFDRIYYLTDNAGEVVFDLLVIDELERLGKEVVIGPKAAPILNDVTGDELSGMTGRRIVPTGDVVGLSLESTSQESLDLLRDGRWLVIAKGMGNYETISEFDQMLVDRLIYILRAKCEPVARALGVPKGTLVVRAV